MRANKVTRRTCPLGRRLRQSAGETLVETLAAIVICVLASLVMVTSVATATNMNAQARDDDAMYEELRVRAELGPEFEGATPRPGLVQIVPSSNESGMGGEAVQVDVYGGANEYGAEAWSYEVSHE